MRSIHFRNTNAGTITGICALAVTAFLCSLASPASAGTTTYKYDAQNRLVEVDYPNGSKIIYTYDAAGNCTSIVKST